MPSFLCYLCKGLTLNGGLDLESLREKLELEMGIETWVFQSGNQRDK